jgi:hypothetical protein
MHQNKKKRRRHSLLDQGADYQCDHSHYQQVHQLVPLPRLRLLLAAPVLLRLSSSSSYRLVLELEQLFLVPQPRQLLLKLVFVLEC